MAISGYLPAPHVFFQMPRPFCVQWPMDCTGNPTDLDGLWRLEMLRTSEGGWYLKHSKTNENIPQWQVIVHPCKICNMNIAFSKQKPFFGYVWDDSLQNQSFCWGRWKGNHGSNMFQQLLQLKTVLEGREWKGQWQCPENEHYCCLQTCSCNVSCLILPNNDFNNKLAMTFWNHEKFPTLQTMLPAELHLGLVAD